MWLLVFFYDDSMTSSLDGIEVHAFHTRASAVKELEVQILKMANSISANDDHEEIILHQIEEQLAAVRNNELQLLQYDRYSWQLREIEIK